MREVAKALKQAVAGVVDGNLTYDGDNVPLFDGKIEEKVNTYVLIVASDQATEDEPFDLPLVTMNLSFIIVNKRHATAQSAVLEDLSDQIKQLINPTKNTEGFTLAAPFHLVGCQFVSAGEDQVVDLPNKVLAHTKRINFRTTIIENET